MSLQVIDEYKCKIDIQHDQKIVPQQHNITGVNSRDIHYKAIIEGRQGTDMQMINIGLLNGE